MCKQSSLTIASKIPSHLSGRLKWTCTDIFLDALASDQWGLGLRCSVLGCASHSEPIQSHIISGHHWGYSIHSGGYNIYYVGCTPPSDIPRNSWETWPFQLPPSQKKARHRHPKVLRPPSRTSYEACLMDQGVLDDKQTSTTLCVQDVSHHLRRIKLVKFQGGDEKTHGCRGYSIEHVYNVNLYLTHAIYRYLQ